MKRANGARDIYVLSSIATMILPLRRTRVLHEAY